MLQHKVGLVWNLHIWFGLLVFGLVWPGFEGLVWFLCCLARLARHSLIHNMTSRRLDHGVLAVGYGSATQENGRNKVWLNPFWVREQLKIDDQLTIDVASGLLACEEQLGREVGNGWLYSGSLQNQPERTKQINYKISSMKLKLPQMVRNERNACGIATQASYPVVWVAS